MGLIDKIGLFPLELVVFPDETVNLHIFEARYRKLINHCVEEQKPFGIPPFIDNNLCQEGALMEVSEVAQIYPDGKLDIKVKSIGRFTILNLDLKQDSSTYHEAEVDKDEDIDKSEGDYRMELLSLADEWGRLLQLDLKINKTEGSLSYLLGHKVGLSLEQEYRLMTLKGESRRQLFLIEHLKDIFPKVREIERSRRLIMMNGHFRSIEPPIF